MDLGFGIFPALLYHFPVSSFTRRFGIPLLALLIGWQLGVGYGQGAFSPRVPFTSVADTGSGEVLANPEQEADVSVLWRAWRLLNANYIEPERLTSRTLVDGAVAGLVHAVGDPYTVFQTAAQDEDFRDNLAGNLQGIGAELQEKDGVIVIVAPLKESPAEKAGMLPQDVITEVDGNSIIGQTLNEVVAKIRGPKGTSVQLTLVRTGQSEPIVLSITRAEIHVPSVETTSITRDGKTIGHIALRQFGDTSIEELRVELQKLSLQKVDAIVLDLRFNGGGYLDGAVDLVSFFVREGEVVTVQHRTGSPERHTVSGRPLLPDIPLAVLQNEGSASASEIVAGALQDHGRATIIGTQSFGKGTVQEIFDLPEGGSMRITVAKWLTPNGKDLGKEGVHPDIEVVRTAEDYAADPPRDPQLDAAVEWLVHGKRSSSTSSVAPGSASGN